MKLLIFYGWCFISGIVFGYLGVKWKLPFWFTGMVVGTMNLIIGLIVL